MEDILNSLFTKNFRSVCKEEVSFGKMNLFIEGKNYRIQTISYEPCWKKIFRNLPRNRQHAQNVVNIKGHDKHFASIIRNNKLYF